MRFYLASVSRCEVLFASFPALVLEDHPRCGECHLAVGRTLFDGPGEISVNSSSGLARTNKLFRTQYSRNHRDISDVCNTIFFLFRFFFFFFSLIALIALSIDTPACACLWLKMRITIFTNVCSYLYICALVFTCIYDDLCEKAYQRDHPYSFYDLYRLKYRLSYRHRRRRPPRSRPRLLALAAIAASSPGSDLYPLMYLLASRFRYFRRDVLGRLIQDATVDRWTLSITF